MEYKNLRCWILAMLAVLSIAAGATDGRVRVGLAWQPNEAAYERVIMSIEAAGGEAVILPQVRPAGFDYDSVLLCAKYVDEMGVLLQEYADIIKRNTYHDTDIAKQMEGIHAVVFLGGGDISSTLFRFPQPWHGIEDDSPADATRDVSEYLTMAYCLDHDLAVLGLCRGMQLLGVVSGASLIQDLSQFFDEMGKKYNYLHREQRDRYGHRHYTPHDVVVTHRSSLLYAIAGEDTISNVPSWHHQVVGDVTGTPLQVTGITVTDGVDLIEAIERTDKCFALGVQYHPEEVVRMHNAQASDANRFMPLDDAVNYFKALIDAVRER